jgi:hypothetical protein
MFSLPREIIYETLKRGKMKRKITIIVLTLALLVSAAGNVNGGQGKKPTSCDLKSDMRKLWEDHIIWTRNVIFNIIDELPGTNEAVTRLLQNQVDIGNAIKPYYGVAAGNQLTALLQEHITIAAELLTALDDGNTAAYNAAWTRWLANADAIATLLSSVNPNWPLAEMKAMLRAHLDATAAEALARKTANYAGDVAAFDHVHLQALEMADMLTEGIVKQFPNMFSGCPLKDPKKPTSCDLKSDMRKLWEDHIIWTRNVIFNIIDELPGTNEAVARLLQNQVDIGNAIKPYYGVAAGNQLTALLHEHITIAAELLTALDDGNTAAYNEAWARWLANADAIATLLSSVNPNWPLAEMKAMMRAHLDATAAEALARKTANYAGDVAAFDHVHLQILEMADMLTEGIVKQFPNMFSSCSNTNTHKEQVSNNRVVLNQNSPNPFDDKTVISYFIPENVKQAQILVYDNMGMLVKKFDIKRTGEGNVTFYSNNSGIGIYSYSIVADGKLIDTKKMIH